MLGFKEAKDSKTQNTTAEIISRCLLCIASDTITTNLVTSARSSSRLKPCLAPSAVSVCRQHAYAYLRD